jgi:hypothetical protein
VEAWKLLSGANAITDNALSVKTARYFLPGTILTNERKTGLSGLRNGYWNVKHLKH